jgi:DNA-binding transcriptional LysR family regulator
VPPRPRVRFDEIALFVEVAAAGSLAAAAKRLGLPKSTVGRAITRIEQDLGVALVRRMARGQGLTEPGRRLAGVASGHIAALRDLASALTSEASEPYGTLRVTTTADVGTLVLGPLVVEFTARYPRIRVELDLTTRPVDLVREGFDLALRLTRRGLPSSALVAKKLARVELGLYAGTSYVMRRGLAKLPADLTQHSIVGFRELDGGDVLTLESVTGDKSTVRVAVNGSVSANDIFFVREAVNAGAGIGALPWFVARSDLAAGRVVRVLPEYRLGLTTAYLLHAAAQPLPLKLQVFRAFLLEHAPRMLTHA